MTIGISVFLPVFSLFILISLSDPLIFLSNPPNSSLFSYPFPTHYPAICLHRLHFRFIMVENPYSPVQLQEVLSSCHDNTHIFNAHHDIHGPIIAKIYKFNNFSEAAYIIREVFLQAKFAHQNVCKILDVTFVTTRLGNYELVLSLEKLEGDLRNEINRRAVRSEEYSEEELWEFLRITTDALFAAQEAVPLTQNICHRDIKPANIFLSTTGEYKIGDFGSAKITASKIDLHSVSGTVNFMSPELYLAHSNRRGDVNYDPYRSDVYSLGVTLLAMATLNNMGIPKMVDLDKELQRLKYSPDLQSILRLMLHPEPSRPDFRELKAYLDSQRPDPLSDAKLTKFNTIQQEIATNREATAILASNLEELWKLSLLSMWKLPPNASLKSIQFYQRKVEMQRSFAYCSTESSETCLNSYPFHYIPITEFVTDFRYDMPLVVEKTSTNGDEFVVVKVISGQCGCFQPRKGSGECMFTVVKEYSTVTISEPATSTPKVIIRLIPNDPVSLLPDSIFRLGTLQLIITSISRTSLTIQLKNSIESSAISHTFRREDSPIRIGKRTERSLEIPKCRGLAHDHVEIRWAETHWTLTDVGSKNGTWRHCHSFNSTTRNSDELRLQNRQLVNYDTDIYRFRLGNSS